MARAAKPFKWTFTRRDLHALLAKLKKRRRPAAQRQSRPRSFGAVSLVAEHAQFIDAPLAGGLVPG